MDRLSGCFAVLLFSLRAISGVDQSKGRFQSDSDEQFQFPTANRSLLHTWTEAHDLCSKRGMRLPIIKTPYDQFLLSNFLQTKGVFEYDVWLGAKTNLNHEWQWLNGSRLTGYRFASEKNGSGYGYIQTSTMTLENSSTSREEHNFICEYNDNMTLADLCEDKERECFKNYRPFYSIKNQSNKCYIPYKHTLSWYNARNFCLRSGGDLATSCDVMDSFSRYNFIKNESFWVGLRQTKWKWDNEEDVSFTYFRSTDLDHTNSDCLNALRSDQWIWDTRPCNESKNNRILVVCQKESYSANLTLWMTNTSSLPPLGRPDLSDSTRSWKMATVALIVITTTLLFIVGVLLVFLFRSYKKIDPHEQPTDMNDEEVKRTQEVAALSYKVEESRATQTAQALKKTTDVEETLKKLPRETQAKPDFTPVTLQQVPITGHSAIPIHTKQHVEVNRAQVHRRHTSSLSSINYENWNATDVPPVKIVPPTTTNSRKVKPKPKPGTKLTDPTWKGPLKPSSYLEVYDVERPESPSFDTGNRANASVSVSQQIDGNSSTLRIRNDYDHLMVQRTSLSLDITFPRGGEAVSYANKSYSSTYQKGKFPTDSDGYLQPKDYEQGSASSKIKQHSPFPANCDSSVYVNGSEVAPSNQTFTNKATAKKGGKLADNSGYVNGSEVEPSNSNMRNKPRKATAKKDGKLTYKFRSKRQRSRPMNPVSPTKFVSPFRKYSAGRYGTIDRSNSGEGGSKSSSHTYMEIALVDDDEVFSSPTQASDVQPIKTQLTKLRKKLSAKMWSENEDAVGY